jgi:hypothetical protein
MSDSERKRITWTARISVRPSIIEKVRVFAAEEKVSVAHMIGTALADYVTARST